MRAWIAALCLAAPAAAEINDSDLSAGPSAQSAAALETEGRSEGEVLVFAAGAAARPSATGAVTARLPRLARARLLGPGAPDGWTETGADGALSLAAAGLSGIYRLRVSLNNRYWAFRAKNGKTYEWETPPFALSGAGADLGTVLPPQSSENAKLMILHATYLEALGLLEREGDLDWWTRPLSVTWPGSADFFNGWGVELTNALAWDVNLHELGHAVMRGSMRARMRGGQHKIDECYSQELAWSEGWATFFAASVRLKRDDADAKFEHLVPRRAPIRLENVPADVCQGPTNEWRVAAGFWDLHDLHDDGGDRWASPFALLWKATRGQTLGSVGEAWELLAHLLSPADRRAAEEALAHNTLLKPRTTPSVALSMPCFE